MKLSKDLLETGLLDKKITVLRTLMSRCITHHSEATAVARYVNISSVVEF